MKVTRIKYDKNAEVDYHGEKFKLIELLKKLRSEKKISMEKISEIIKGNKYWYSQIEYKERRTYIAKSELIQIISVIKFGAKNLEDLAKCEMFSEDFIKDIHLEPVDTPYRYPRPTKDSEDVEEQSKKIDLLLNSICQSIRECIESVEVSERDDLIRCLKNFNRTIKHNSIFALWLIGLEFAPIFDQSTAILYYNFLNEIQNVLDKRELENICVTPQELALEIDECYSKYREKVAPFFSKYKDWAVKF